MTKKLGVIMDPIASIKYEKDTTLGLLLEARRREYDIYYMEMQDLFYKDNRVYSHLHELDVFNDPNRWYNFGKQTIQALTDLDIILMRKDPPVDTDYIYCTYLLELVEKQGVLVVNSPQNLRDVNEKLFTSWFPDCCPETLVASNKTVLKNFIKDQKDVILKPLHGMGGFSIFRIKEDDPNLNVTIEMLTHFEKRHIMAQRYIPEITQGDKRILMIDGKPIPYALARMASKGETRANLASGGTGIGQPLSEQDLWICQQVGPTLKAKGLFFVGLDVIGDYLTEINVTSPTCMRELEKQFNINIAAQFFEAIEARL